MGQEVLAEGDVDEHSLARALAVVQGDGGRHCNGDAGAGVRRDGERHALRPHVRVAHHRRVAVGGLEGCADAPVRGQGPVCPKPVMEIIISLGFHRLTTS